MIDKSWKLQKYSRKDYSEVVEFPVEIVGRDGLVRRYTYDESIRLYQRRITFAPIRYRDGEIAGAEIRHCRSRIHQLRRSFFHHFGWGTPVGERSPTTVFGEIAGEIAAFVCRILNCEDRPNISLSMVQQTNDTASIWYLTRQDVASRTPEKSRPPGMLLYVHRFDGKDVEQMRDSFFQQLKDLEGMGRFGGENERILAFHHTIDCGLVLTGRGLDYDQLLAQQRSETPRAPQLLTLWDEVLDVVRLGDDSRGLLLCRELIAQQPWHRDAYLMGASLALSLGSPVETEEFSTLGGRLFPNDSLMHFFRGMAALHQEREAEAEQAFRRALATDQPFIGTQAQLAVSLFRQWRFADAHALLSEVPSTDHPLARSLARLRRTVPLGIAVLVTSLFMVAASIVGAFHFGLLGLAPLLPIFSFQVAAIVSISHDFATAERRCAEAAREELIRSCRPGDPDPVS